MTSRGRPANPFVSRVTKRLERLGLQQPAVVVLEASRPFAFLAGQLLWMAEPALKLMMPAAAVSETAELLEDPASVEALIELLESEEGNGVGGPEWT